MEIIYDSVDIKQLITEHLKKVGYDIDHFRVEMYDDCDDFDIVATVKPKSVTTATTTYRGDGKDF